MSVGVVAARTLASCGARGELLLVEAAQRSAQPHVRAAAVSGLLGRCPGALRTVLLACRDASEVVRAAATNVLRSVDVAAACEHTHSLLGGERSLWRRSVVDAQAQVEDRHVQAAVLVPLGRVLSS